MAGPSRSTASPRRTKGSTSFPDSWADVGLNPTEEVFEQIEETHSSILGPDGKPIPYQSKKLGFVGFWQLKEKTP
jgi:hypothetical protein